MEKNYHIYITNVPKDISDAKDIAKLYGTRWDVELHFKGLKSKYSLDVLDTMNEQVIENLFDY
jgi:IS4 transposase